MELATKGTMKLAGISLLLFGLILAYSGPVLSILFMGSGLAVLVTAVVLDRMKPAPEPSPSASGKRAGLPPILLGVLLVIVVAVYLPSVQLGGGASFVLLGAAGLGVGLVIVGAVRGVTRAVASIRR